MNNTLTAGVEGVGAAREETGLGGFVDWSVSAPFRGTGPGRHLSNSSLWLDASLHTLPTGASVPIVAQTAGTQKEHADNQVLEPGFDVLGGLAIRIGSGEIKADALRRWAAALTIGAGTVSNFRTSSTSPTFRVTPELRAHYKLPDTATFISFEQPAAPLKFTWYTGLRLRQFRFARVRSSELRAAPSRLDFDIGQNGPLSRSGAEFSFRASGYYPLGTGRISRAIAVGGRFETLFEKSEMPSKFVTSAADASAGRPTATFVTVLTNADRPSTSWSLGIGVEILSLIGGR